MGCILENFCYNGDKINSVQKQDSKTQLRSPITTISTESSESENRFVKTLSRIAITTSTVIRKHTGNPFDFYEIICKLGQGSFGCVLKVSHKVTKQIRALKMISKDNMIEGCTEEDIEREIGILRRLDHPNVIKIFEFFKDDQFFYIITELCSEGDLCTKLEKLRILNECVVKVLMCQIITAVNYLHLNHVIHGDLKLENLMIDSVIPTIERKQSFATSILTDLSNMKILENPRHSEIYAKFVNLKKFEIKLIDFGCSKMLSPTVKRFHDRIGTLYYIAPEVLQNNYNEKCDIWACGVIMYMLLSGEIPFNGTTEQEIEEKILKGKFDFKPSNFQHVSSNAKDLITKCLTYDPVSRISASDAMNHPFFTDDINLHNIFEDELDSKKILAGLAKYSSKYSKFYTAVLAFLTHNFAEKDEIEELNKIFRAIDTNLDGKLSKEELLQSYQDNEISLSSEDIDHLVHLIDNDNTGYIEYEEFIRATIRKERLLTERNLKSAFDLFDADGKGWISCKEMKEVFGLEKNVADNVILDLLSEIDKKESDKIGIIEFTEIMQGLVANGEKKEKACASTSESEC